jgi:hypothetical protein
LKQTLKGALAMMPTWTQQDLHDRDRTLRRGAEARRRQVAAAERRTPEPVDEIALARAAEVCPEPCVEAPLARAG